MGFVIEYVSALGVSSALLRHKSSERQSNVLGLHNISILDVKHDKETDRAACMGAQTRRNQHIESTSLKPA